MADSETAGRIAAGKAHGTRSQYFYRGCRCFKCRLANADYQTRRKRRREAEGNLLVPIDKARAHVLALSRKGVGRRSLADAADIDPRTIYMIRAAKVDCIQKRIEGAILAVDAGARRGGCLVPSAPTWKRIDALLAGGYTKKQLAKWFGWKYSIQLHRDGLITARNAVRVERISHLIQAGYFRREN